MKRKVIMIAAIIVGATVLLALILPLFINAESFRPTIEARLSAALGRQVQIGKLRLSLWAGGVAADNIAIADDPAFATQPFITAKTLDIHVDLLPLLLRREVHINSLTVLAPQVTLIRVGERWNASSIGPKPVPGAAPQASAAASPSSLELRKLVLSGGELTIRELGATKVFSDLEIKATDLSTVGVFPFSMDVKLPGDGKLTLTGKAGPMPAGDMMELPVEASLKIEHLDLAAYTAQGAAVGGSAEVQATLRSDGRQAHLEGSGSIGKFFLAKGGTPSPQPVGLTFVADYNLKTQSGELTAADLRFGKSGSHLSGTFQLTGNTSQLNLTLVAQDVQAEDVEHVLRAQAISLPGGASLQSGTASANLAITGPSNALAVDGEVHVQSLTVAGFDLGSQLKAISALASFNTGPNTVLQSLDAKLHLTASLTKLDDIKAVVVGVGSVTGAGAIAGQKDLDFHLVAHLSPSGGLLGGLIKSAGVNPLSSIPFRVEGTTSNPKFAPDMNAMFHGQNASAPGKTQIKSVGSALNQLFKKRK
jgi:AsmA protein